MFHPPVAEKAPVAERPFWGTRNRSIAGSSQAYNVHGGAQTQISDSFRDDYRGIVASCAALLVWHGAEHHQVADGAVLLRPTPVVTDDLAERRPADARCGNAAKVGIGASSATCLPLGGDPVVQLTAGGRATLTQRGIAGPTGDGPSESDTDVPRALGRRCAGGRVSQRFVVSIANLRSALVRWDTALTRALDRAADGRQIPATIGNGVFCRYWSR